MKSEEIKKTNSSDTSKSRREDESKQEKVQIDYNLLTVNKEEAYIYNKEEFFVPGVDADTEPKKLFNSYTTNDSTEIKRKSLSKNKISRKNSS